MLDIQCFNRDGVWQKPADATVVDVTAGGAFRAGVPSEIRSASFLAASLPDSIQVTIGRGGAGGLDGFAVVVCS